MHPSKKVESAVINGSMVYFSAVVCNCYYNSLN